MLTVSIVTYNTKIDELDSCLRSLDSRAVKTIYVIDNSSQSYIKDYCSTQDRVIYIASENVGYGAGHNQALRRVLAQNDSDCKYHLVLNSDVYFKPEIVERLTEYMDSNEEVAQVQPRIEYPNGKLQYTVRLLPTPANLIFRRFLPYLLGKKMDDKYVLADWDHKSELDIAYHQGSFMFFRLSAFAKVGLFDERFFMYPEDIDITRRMHKLYKTMYWPKVTIVHAHKAESYKSKKMLKIHMVNMIKYFNKWGWLFDKERSSWNKDILKKIS